MHHLQLEESRAALGCTFTAAQPARIPLIFFIPLLWYQADQSHSWGLGCSRVYFDSEAMFSPWEVKPIFTITARRLCSSYIPPARLALAKLVWAARVCMVLFWQKVSMVLYVVSYLKGHRFCCWVLFSRPVHNSWHFFALTFCIDLERKIILWASV
jgi:hypothetical protein